jgi:HlyD family secretion protein
MARKSVIRLIVAGVVLATILYFMLRSGPSSLVLTGIVTTNDVIVSPQVAGQVTRLLVAEGDSVLANQLLGTISPAELQADRNFYSRSATALGAQARAGEADLAASIAQDSEAQADLINAKSVLDRSEALFKAGGITQQEIDSARTGYSVRQSRAVAADRLVAAKREALAAAHAQQDAAAAQTTKADVRLGYAELRAPMAGIVDVRAVREGEVVGAGQPVLTLINPDSLWVRADVEESYVDRARLGDTLMVRFPSGETRRGVVFFRGVDADFATQRDVSRTKRDIKTFEIRLHVDNGDRRLAVGMTAYVLLPLTLPARRP